MNKDNEHMIYTASDIEQYLAGELSPLQMHTMEKAALDDPFLAEAIEGYHEMKDRKWKDALLLLRTQIENKGSGAKVIPLHKSNNNWWKMAAAVFILGTAATLTFVFKKDNTENVTGPQIAQMISQPIDSLPQKNDEVPASVTISLNPTASATKEDIKAITLPEINNLSSNQAKDRPIAESGAQQQSPSQKNGATGATDNANGISTIPSTNSQAPIANNNEQLAQEMLSSKTNQAAKENRDDVAFLREKKLTNLNANPKESAFNNFFTAQVVSADNTPLPFTNISIKKENFGTYTDAKGMVRLVSTDSTLNIDVKSVGYAQKTFTLRNNQTPTRLVLQEDEIAQKDKRIVGNTELNKPGKSRRATLLSDSAVNVEPADGWDNYNTYVANNLDIPETMLKRDFHGEVELSFDVKSNGTISNIRIHKSLGAEYDEAAKRLLMSGPQWKVKKGKKTSAKVKVQF